MCYSLLCGRHDRVIGCNDDDSDIRYLCSTGTHGSECLVTRGVKERDAASVRQLHVVCADVLRDASGLAGNDIGLAHIVQQRGLTVIHVSHDGDDRRTRDKFALVILLLVDCLLHFGADIFRSVSELISHQIDGLGVQTLVDTYHDTDRHERSDELCDRHIHHRGKL